MIRIMVQDSRDDSLVYLESLEDSQVVARETDRTEEPGGSDVLRIEGPVASGAPAPIVGTGTRVGRGGRGSSHDSSLGKAPFINRISEEPRALLSPCPYIYIYISPLAINSTFDHTHLEDMPSVSHHLRPYFFCRFSRLLARVGEKFRAIFGGVSYIPNMHNAGFSIIAD